MDMVGGGMQCQEGWGECRGGGGGGGVADQIHVIIIPSHDYY